MKKSILISVILAGALILGGCRNSVEPPAVNIDNGSNNDDIGDDNPGELGGDSNDSSIKVVTANGTTVSVTAGTATTVDRGDNTRASVVHTELNECADKTTGSPVVCGPKEGVTYVFQSNFGSLGGAITGQGDLDNNASTPDGGALLFDALTAYNGTVFDTPLEGNPQENRIHEVYIPTNYIVLSDAAKSANVSQQYEYIRTYLANVFNMQCMMSEDKNNPYFHDFNTSTPLNDNRETGKFLATYVMHFTKGAGEADLLEQFKTDTANLEYLTISFELDIDRVDGNSSVLRFTSPADTPIVLRAKKAGQLGIQVQTSNLSINSVLNPSQNYVHNSFSVNMAKYFDKLIAKGESIGVADYAKDILVENSTNPWPVKIYGTLHEINDDGSFKRSFVRNPAELNASLFGLDMIGPHSAAYLRTNGNGNTNQAMKFNIVYPGGVYNKLSN